MSATSSMTDALASMVAAEAELVDKLAAVRQVLTSLRAYLGVTEAPASTVSQQGGRSPSPRITKEPHPAPRPSKGDKTKDKIRAALARGPMSPGDLAEKLGIERPALRYQVKQLEADGVVVSTGTTAGRRVALAGAAKEEP